MTDRPADNRRKAYVLDTNVLIYLLQGNREFGEQVAKLVKRANSNAVASPKPEPPPVTNADFPSIFMVYLYFQ